MRVTSIEPPGLRPQGLLCIKPTRWIPDKTKGFSGNPKCHELPSIGSPDLIRGPVLAPYFNLGPLQILGRLHFTDFIPQIAPCWIFFLNERNFPGALPSFNSFFPQQANMWLCVLFKPNKPGDIIFLSETGNDFVFVLPNPFYKIVCSPDIKGSIGLAGQDVNIEINPVHRIKVMNAMQKRKMDPG